MLVCRSFLKNCLGLGLERCRHTGREKALDKKNNWTRLPELSNFDLFGTRLWVIVWSSATIEKRARAYQEADEVGGICE